MTKMLNKGFYITVEYLKLKTKQNDNSLIS